MSLSTLRGSKTKSFRIIPPITFEATEPKKLPKHKYRSFEVPISKGSKQMMKLEGYIYDSGNCEQFLLWQDQINSILSGLNIKRYEDKINLIDQLVEGDLKNKFVSAKNKTEREVNRLANAGETAMSEDGQFVHTMQQLTKNVFPKKALMLQKFYMSHYMRKQKEVTTDNYRSRVATMNAQLEKFPPFQTGQSFTDDELKANAFFNFPNSYIRQLTLQGFEITENTLDDLYDAFERIESCQIEDSVAGDKHKQESANKPRKKARFNPTSQSGSTFCELHGPNKGHNTGECKVLLQQARKMKENFRSNKRDFKGYSKSPNFPKTKAELNSYAEKYFKSKMKSIEKDHFCMDAFNHDDKMDEEKINDEESKGEDTLDQENDNFEKDFQKDLESSDEEDSE